MTEDEGEVETEQGELRPKILVGSPDGTRRSEHELVTERVTIGRAVPGYAPDIVLAPDPQSWISRLHCWLECIDGSWWVVDNGSVNGTLLERQGQRETVEGRRRVQDRDEILILGYLVDDEPFWWRLRFDDPFATADAPRRTATDDAPYVEYRLAEATLSVVANGERIDIPQLGRNRHKLVRYMARRNAANGGMPVTCTHDELITAVWGPPETWRFQKAYTAENLRDLIFELRRKLSPHDGLVETTPGIGYSLRTMIL